VSRHHESGAEAEVDWGEAGAMIDGQRVKVHPFQLRLWHSAGGVAAAFRNETQQTSPEAHAEAFELLGGVPALIRYYNLTSAVCEADLGRQITGHAPPRPKAMGSA
jgi:transposase